MPPKQQVVYETTWNKDGIYIMQKFKRGKPNIRFGTKNAETNHSSAMISVCVGGGGQVFPDYRSTFSVAYICFLGMRVSHVCGVDINGQNTAQKISLLRISSLSCCCLQNVEISRDYTKHSFHEGKMLLV